MPKAFAAVSGRRRTRAHPRVETASRSACPVADSAAGPRSPSRTAPPNVNSWPSIPGALRICCRPDHLRKTGSIALLVGTWITFVNQADAIIDHGITAGVLFKLAMNYLTPFVVSNLGLLSRGN